jgi:carbon storage regulator CsrA
MGLLTLTRKPKEWILIGDDIAIQVTRIDARGQVRLTIDAPDDVKIMREELLTVGSKTAQTGSGRP